MASKKSKPQVSHDNENDWTIDTSIGSVWFTIGPYSLYILPKSKKGKKLRIELFKLGYEMSLPIGEIDVE